MVHGLTAERAEICAAIFADNSLEGIYSHGINRFPRFIRYIRNGYIDVDAVPTLTHRSGAMEQWNGNLGPGPLNAVFAAERVIRIAGEFGVGMLGLANTNHWMRGGTYGWKAARAGYIFIGWTNTTPNMPAWGGKDPRLGNNPLVIAIPYGTDAIVLDMAMSQYSFGKMEEKQLSGEKLPTPGGYDIDGHLTDDPGKILASWRSLPVGYWKGVALSMMLDMLAALLSGGLSTAAIGKNKDEYGISQVYIAMDPAGLSNFPVIGKTMDEIIMDFKKSVPVDDGTTFRYPGERALQIRQENMKSGIPVNPGVWEEICSL